MKYIVFLYSKSVVLVVCCCFAICVSKAQIIITATGGSENGYLIRDSISFKKKVFHKPQHITYDKEGNLYISSIESNCIYKVEAKTKIVTTFVNTTHSPFGFAFDNTEENLYIGESSSCVEKYNVKTRSLSLFAGVPGT